MIEIYAININEAINNKEKLRDLLPYVSEKSIKKVNRLLHIKDKYRTLLGEILVRLVIAKRHSIANCDYKILTNNYGKPYLHNINNFEFNISHAGDWVVCAIDDTPIGIDVEKIKVINYSEIAQRFFAKNENRFLKDTSEHKKLRCFFKIWTLKESYIKAVGKGLSIPLKSFDIDISEDDIKIEVNNYVYYFKVYNIDETHQLSVCSEKSVFPKNVTFMSFDDIFKNKYLLVNKST